MSHANFRPIRCGYDAAFRGYATTRIGRGCHQTRIPL